MKKYCLKYLLIFGLIACILGSWFIQNLIQKIYPTHTILDQSPSLATQYPIEANYTQMMRDIITPSLSLIENEAILTTSEDIDIYYRSYLVPNSKGTIVISHGFSEWIDKYNELIYYFTQNNYSVYIPSHRGHGLSTRLVEDLSMVHIDDFNDYVEDLKHLISEVVLPHKGDQPLILFGHSMGGGIATLLLENYPELIDLAILSSPMLEVKLPGVPNFLGYLVAQFFDFIGQGTDYVFTHGPFTGIPNFEESSTQSESRYHHYFNIRASDDYYHTEGGSFSWLKEALSATKSMIKNAHLIEIPVLLFQSELDELVKPDGQNQFVKKAQNAEMVFVPNAKHELYFEKDEILLPYLDKIFNFLDTHL